MRYKGSGDQFVSITNSTGGTSLNGQLESIRNKHVVVIGGTSGIGRAVAQQAAAAGARVTVASRNRQRVDETVVMLGAPAQGRVVDVTDPESVRAFFGEAGEIDHLVLPGNKVSIGPFRKLTIAEAQASMASKFWGQYAAIKAARMAATGSVVLFSGVASRKPGMGAPALTAINAAVEALGQALAVELAPVRVNVIAPGVVETEIWAGLPEERRAAMLKSFTERQPIKRPGRPEEIAAVVLTMMGATYMTGAVIDVDGGGLLV
jgi:NAD(P)-dependent dehydrogenase (short-subunit alcohol dehydrogenase family)